MAWIVISNNTTGCLGSSRFSKTFHLSKWIFISQFETVKSNGRGEDELYLFCSHSVLVVFFSISCFYTLQSHLYSKPFVLLACQICAWHCICLVDDQGCELHSLSCEEGQGFVFSLLSFSLLSHLVGTTMAESCRRMFALCKQTDWCQRCLGIFTSCNWTGLREPSHILMHPQSQGWQEHLTSNLWIHFITRANKCRHTQSDMDELYLKTELYYS